MQFTQLDKDGPRIWKAGKTSSSLDLAWQMILENRLGEWDSIVAESQDAGRGQLRRKWESPPGNVYAAVRLPFVHPFTNTSASPAISALIARALLRIGFPVMMKWPNDLVVVCKGRPQKIAGILLEERDGVLLAGIGINIVWAPEDAALRKDAALSAARLADFLPAGEIVPDAFELWCQLVKYIYSEYAFSLFRDKWTTLANQILLWRGDFVEVVDGSETKSGILKGLLPNGGICISFNGHTEACFNGTLRFLTV